MKGIKLFAGKAAQRAIARSVWRSEQEEKQQSRPQYCDKAECVCYWPECAAHGCMDSDDD